MVEPLFEQFVDIVLLAFMAVTVYAVGQAAQSLRRDHAGQHLQPAGGGDVRAARRGRRRLHRSRRRGRHFKPFLALGTLALTKSREKTPTRRRILPLAVVGVTGAALVYGTLDMPHYGDPNAPSIGYVAPDYLKNAPRETGIPNVVTSVLASYRGYDTLGETTVVFTAGIGVILLLGNWRRRPRKDDEDA